MSVEDNKAIVGRWFTEFWGPEFKPAVIDEIASPDLRFEYSLPAPCKGRDQVRQLATAFRAAFPDLAFGATADLIVEGDHVVGQWIGGGTHTRDAMTDRPMGDLPVAPSYQCCTHAQCVGEYRGPRLPSGYRRHRPDFGRGARRAPRARRG